MDGTVRSRLLREIEVGGAAYVRNVTAAETAVLQGQFNVAKILRAAGHTQRVLAMNAARLLQPSVDGSQLFHTILDELDLAVDGISQADSEGDEAAIRLFFERREQVSTRLLDILQRGLASLTSNPDVLEKDVSIFLSGCYSCGYLTEGERLGQCPLCGAPAAELAHFGPYYNDTPEHLGRLLPAEIVDVLVAAPDDLAAAVEGVGDAVLDRKPTPEEWSVRVLMAHLIETDRLFLDLTPGVLANPTVYPLVFREAPWKAHEGKGYESWSAQQLVEEFRGTRRQVLDLIRDLTPELWSRYGSRPGRITSVLDLGRWVANHDVGHIAQVRRQCEAG
ncbi:MAG: DinB family protein [Caldilineaceae bacterium]